MACGCTQECACTVVGGDGITVEGNGRPGTPFVVSSGDVDICPDVGDCVCDMATAGTGVDCAPDSLSVLPSADAGNVIVTGSDGRLYAGDMPPEPPPEPVLQSGTVGVPFTSSTTAWADVTFPAPFADPPEVVALVNHGQSIGTTAAVYAIRAANVTTTGCRLFLHRTESGTPITATVNTAWFARGLPAGP